MACNNTSIAHTGLIYAGQVLAGAGIDLLENPGKVKQAKEEFIRNLDGRIYCCPIPDDIQPDVEK